MRRQVQGLSAGESTFVGFSLFMDRAILIAAEIEKHFV